MEAGITVEGKMSVSLRVGKETYEIGSPDFLQAFFSTISHNLEPQGWGTVYPTLLNVLYQGSLPSSKVAVALSELRQIRQLLVLLPPCKVVWDIENLAKRPPWGDDINPKIKNIAEYFVTSDGKDLFEVLTKAFERALEQKSDIQIT